MAEVLCLRLDKRQGESALRKIRELQLLDKHFKITRRENRLLFPLLRYPSEHELSLLKKQLGNFEIGRYFLTELTLKSATIFDVLKDQLSPHQLASLPKAIDIVGEVGVVEIPEELRELERAIGEALLKTNRNIRTVLAKASPISTEKRLRQFRVIAGSGITETTHKEYGCSFRVDLTKAYFSPRLSHEHHRVASQVREGETVVDMFAGVGPFAIQIAKRRKNVCVYAIDLNEDAVIYLRENVKLNRVEDRVIPMSGDARVIIKASLVGKSDRVIMNLPAESIEYVDVACLAIKADGGIMHYYAFASGTDPLKKAENELSEAVMRAGRRFERSLHSRIVRGTAPHEWMLVVDGLVK